MMKILYVTRRFYPDMTGGGQVSAYHIAKSVKALGHDVSVLTFTTGKYSAEDLDGIKVYRFPLIYSSVPLLSHFLNLEGMYAQMAWRLNSFLHKGDYDAVHLLNIESIYFSTWILKRKKIPSFATINGPCLCWTGDCTDANGKTCLHCSPGKAFKCFMNRRKTGGLFAYAKTAVKSAYETMHLLELKIFLRRVDRIFPVSHAIEQMLLADGFAPGKLAVIHNPVPVNVKVKTDLKERLGISGKKVLIYAGRVNETKGVHRVVEAMKDLQGCVFLIVGRGRYGNDKTPYYSSLEETVRKEKLGDRVKFIGFVEPKDMPEYYSIADVAVLPGTFYEPLSRMLLEAAGYGIPLVAYDTGGNPEVVADGVNGMLLKTLEPSEIASSVKYILSNPMVYESMSANAKKKVLDEYSPEKIGQELASQYRSIQKLNGK